MWVNYFCNYICLGWFKPDITTFSACTLQLRISRYDRKPLSSLDLMHSAAVEVTQRASLSSTEPTSLTLPVPEDGNVQIKLKLQNQTAMLLIRVSILIHNLWNHCRRTREIPGSSFRPVTQKSTQGHAYHVILSGINLPSFTQIPSISFVGVKTGCFTQHFHVFLFLYSGQIPV